MGKYHSEKMEIYLRLRYYMKIASFDIGGANTDLAVLEFNESGTIIDIRTDHQYLPMWTKKNELVETLLELLGQDRLEIDALGVCMTAELADAYNTKTEGVLDIANKVVKAMNISLTPTKDLKVKAETSIELPLGFVGLKGIMNYQEIGKNPMEIAAANWIATAPLAACISPNCIFIDTGSTTTDIIPIKNGRECAKGRSDLERLATGELVYTGVLRTNLATLVHRVPLGQDCVRVASELFSITADIHIVLDNINEEDYSSDTPDGAGKSKEDCLRRISRMVCADLDLISPDDGENMANYIYQKQLERVAEALQEVSERENLEEVVVTGRGMDIIGRNAAEILGLKVRGMDMILSKEECAVAPAIGTAILMQSYLER
jgi:(4-(4-[2-(gamma-L-glutamylamino)ethyl]phenoxymethyl)furan-2-yl)methanamine synthase